jgi:hypothetical protein
MSQHMGELCKASVLKRRRYATCEAAGATAAFCETRMQSQSKTFIKNLDNLELTAADY